MDLSIVTVTYNSAKFIKEHLDSLIKNLPPKSEIIIVDNNSADETVSIIEKYKSVRLIKSSENVGFSKGNNKGAKAAKGEYLFFLNPDIKTLNNSVQKLMDYANLTDNVGIVAPQLIKENGGVQASVTNLPNLKNLFLEYLFNKKNVFSEYAPTGNEATKVEAVYGAAMLIKKELFLKIGGFDERYFLFYEDLDLCRKVRKLGYKVIYFPQAKFIHLVGASMGKDGEMPFGVRTIALFFPIKKSGSKYYQIKSGNIYHGLLLATLIRLFSYIAVKLSLTK